MSHTLSTNFIAPEKRITPKMRESLEELAPKFQITLTTVVIDGHEHVEFSGEGFSESEPVAVRAEEATVRLLAEICSILARWIPFSLWEPCEVTLFALPPERIERCAASFRKQLAQLQRQAEREAKEQAAARAVEEARSVLE